MEIRQETQRQYRRIFGMEPEIVVSAPGRVNLIGEHTDYNGGYVLPIAIDRSIVMASGRRNDRELHFHALDPGASKVTSLARLTFDSSAPWSNYLQGVVDCLQRRGFSLTGGNFCFRGDIPIGSGLSSSAALEIAFAVGILKLNSIEISNKDLIIAAQEAEQEFVGIRCGIMDQFIAVMGRRDHAMFLDCRSLSFSHVPIPKGISIVVCDNGMRRALAGSGYNRRRAECEEAVKVLSGILPRATSLRDVSVRQLEVAEGRLSTTLYRRAKHVVTENDRVLQCIEAMHAGDLNRIGELLFQSHKSLSVDFEVSTKELDALIEIARNIKGVYGARMTGAGFGGCAICIVAEDRVGSTMENLRTEYFKSTGIPLSLYTIKPADGAYFIFPHQSSTFISVAG
jgi:galactokinase